jgi:hypothetical protein
LNEADEFLYIVKVIIISDDSTSVIDNTSFFVAFKAIQEFCFPVSFYEYGESIWLDLGKHSFSALGITFKTVPDLLFDRAFSVFTNRGARAVAGIASMAMLVFTA